MNMLNQPPAPETRSPAAAPALSRRRLIGLAVLALAVAGGGAWWLSGRHQEASAISESTGPHAPVRDASGAFQLSEHEVRSLRIEAMQARQFMPERMAEGRIAYNEDRSTPIFAPYTGRVLRAIARLGDAVEQGAPLFELESTDLVQASNDLLSAVDNLNKARTTLDLARRNEQRQRDLLAARAAARRDYEQAQADAANAASDLRVAETTLAAARDRLRVLGRTPEQIARIEETRQVNAVVTVTAPIAGTVVQRRVGPGQWLTAGAGDPVYTIADLSTMWLVAAVREMDAPMVRVGQEVTVTVGALPDHNFRARITSIGAGLDPQTRRLPVRAEVEDPEHLLKPEMFATFRINVGTMAEAVAVPTSAVIYRGAEASVWLALPDNRFILRRIQPGMRTGDTLEVLSGLAPGDRVVTGGALFVDRAARVD